MDASDGDITVYDDVGLSIKLEAMVFPPETDSLRVGLGVLCFFVGRYVGFGA